LFAHLGVLAVGGNSYDRVALGVGMLVERDHVADGGGVGQITLGECLIHNYDIWRGAGVGIVEVAAEKQGNSEDMEKIRSNGVPAHRRETGYLRGLSIDDRLRIAAPAFAEALPQERRRFHSGHRAHAGEQRLVEVNGLLIVVDLLLRRESKD